MKSKKVKKDNPKDTMIELAQEVANPPPVVHQFPQGVQDKLKAISAQIDRHKTAIGHLTLQFDTAKNQVYRELSELEQKAQGAVNHLIDNLGLDPAKVRVDYQAMTLTVVE